MPEKVKQFTEYEDYEKIKSQIVDTFKLSGYILEKAIKDDYERRSEWEKFKDEDIILGMKKTTYPFVFIKLLVKYIPRLAELSLDKYDETVIGVMNVPWNESHSDICETLLEKAQHLISEKFRPFYFNNPLSIVFDFRTEGGIYSYKMAFDLKKFGKIEVPFRFLKDYMDELYKRGRINEMLSFGLDARGERIFGFDGKWVIFSVLSEIPSSEEDRYFSGLPISNLPERIRFFIPQFITENGELYIFNYNDDDSAMIDSVIKELRERLAATIDLQTTKFTLRWLLTSVFEYGTPRSFTVLKNILEILKN